MKFDTGWLRYVPHEQRAAYEALGWVWVADMPGHHAEWCVLMSWSVEGEPREPVTLSLKLLKSPF